MNSKMDTNLWHVAAWAMIAFVVAVAIGLSARLAHGETPAEWFSLAIEIQSHDRDLDADERRFIKNVINRLTVSEDAVPTPEHQHWLRNIKRRLKL